MRQWDPSDWACVLSDRRIHNDQASRSVSSRQCTCPFYSSRPGFIGKASHHPRLSAFLQPRCGSLRLLAFPKAKFAVKSVEVCKCDAHTVHKLSQRRLSADWLAPRQSDCSRMYSKVSSDWLPSYIKATRPVLEIFKMAGYFPYSPGIYRFENVFLRCPTPRLHCFLSSHCPSFRFLSFMAFLIPSIQFFFGLPRALFCFDIHFNANLGNLPSTILWTWPCHVSWFCSVSFIIVSSSSICCLIVTFLIISFLDILEDLLSGYL